MAAHVAPALDSGLEGHYAGAVTRFASFVIDVLAIGIVFAIVARVGEYIVSALIGKQVTLSEAPIVSAGLLAGWAFLYSAYPLAAAGHTVGMAIVGVRAVRVDGGDLGARHAVVRVIAFPLSFLLFGLGFVLILLRRDRRALHDLIARTAVVYSWNARAARLRFLARRSPP